MAKNAKWQIELAEYIRQGEPTQIEKSSAWNIAIGLQEVDGLKTSQYLLETAKEHIEGRISIATAQKRIDSYYEEQGIRKSVESDKEEADKVSAKIAELLGEKTFQFSPAEWITIHRRLFTGILNCAGQIRTYNITKKEWVLAGGTVLYASCDSIRATMDYDFNIEKEFSYKGLSISEIVKHIAKFTSGIWQIHPFGEGNTRATAVFIIKYLKTLGFDVNNDAFANNSWYFRNALVRANYNNITEDIHATTEYLELFFENLLMNQKHMLKNRYLHVAYKISADTKEITNMLYEGVAYSVSESADRDASKCKNYTLKHALDCTLEERELLNIVKNNPAITQKQLALRLGKSERTVKTYTVRLQQKGYLARVNGKRNGSWKVLGA